MEMQEMVAMVSEAQEPATPLLPRKQQLYIFLPLSPSSRCIRLLTLHASDRSAVIATEHSLSATFRVVSLDTSPSYVSLSYVWGADGPSPGHTIFCSPEEPFGCELQLTKNCYDALCQVQDNFGGITIWVDSICIDQEDDEQKQGQIVLMQDIYSQAETTYIWLGVGDIRSDRAMDFLRRRAVMARRVPLEYGRAIDTITTVRAIVSFEYKAWQDIVSKYLPIRLSDAGIGMLMRCTYL
jgi:hypothetical protein